MIDIKYTVEDNIIYTTIKDKLRKEDMEEVIQAGSTIIEKHGKARWYIEMQDFKGWDAGALWEDMKFDIKHANEYEKVAMVGGKDWEKVMTNLLKPFTSADVAYFDLDEKDEAKAWIQS